MSDDGRESYAELAKIREDIAKELASNPSDDVRRAIEARDAIILERMWDAFRKECSDPASVVHELSKATTPEEIAAIGLRLGAGPESFAKEYEIWAVETPAAAQRSWWQKIKDLAIRRS
jgi:hypothetical protein